MTGVTKGVILCACAAALVAAFAAGRLTAPLESPAVPADFAAALRAALGEKDAVDRADRTASVLQQLAPENVLEAVVVYDQMINILDETDIRPFVFAWARFDPAAALDHTLSWPFIDKQKMGASAAIESWAMRDPIGARQAYEETHTRLPSLSEDLFVSLMTGWLYSGEPGLDEFLAGLSNVRQEMGITRVAAKLLRSGGTNAVMVWSNSIARNDEYEKKFRKRAFRRGIRLVGRWDPELTAAWAMEHADQAYAVDAPRIVAGYWGARDGPAAMQWVREHPDEEQREFAVREAFRNWLLSDRESAVEWLESETLTAFHQPAIEFFVKDRTDRAPDEAIPWCERLLDSESRQRCLIAAASKWYQRDAVAAETWIQQSSLDEEARRAARTPPRKLKQQQRKRPPGEPKG